MSVILHSDKKVTETHFSAHNAYSRYSYPQVILLLGKLNLNNVDNGSVKLKVTARKCSPKAMPSKKFNSG
jgi:hypothetical protein